jgi:hypothetical protein
MTYRIRSSRPDRQVESPAPAGEVGHGISLTAALAVVVALAMSLGVASPCRADGLVIQAPDLTVTRGSSGSFDVLLVNTNAGGGASYGVSLDSLELALTGAAGVAFTDVTINTIVPYIYTVSATTLPGSDPLDFGIAFPNTGFTVADSDGGSPFFQTVNPGDQFGLANVSYSVSPTFSGSDAITIASLNVGTSLSDINGDAIPFTAINGSITTSSIPEPSALIQATAAILIGLGAFWRRRSRRGAAAC